MSKPWESFTNQKQWRDYLKQLMRTNDKALIKALVLVFENQTDEEKAKYESFVENGRGFDKVDVAKLSALAVKVKHNDKLTAMEMATVRSKVPKYWKQLYYISKEKQGLTGHQNSPDSNMQNEVNEFKRINEKLKLCKEGMPCNLELCEDCAIGTQLKLKV